MEGDRLMKYDYHIIVIGAGSGGLVVASGAAGLGAKVALIEGDKMGGDCLNYGCVPSKTFLRSAHVADTIKQAKDFGIEVSHWSYDIKSIMSRVGHVIEAIEPHDSKERYEGLGVKVYEGYGSLVDRHTVMVNGREITGDKIVIATGSEALIPAIKGLDQVPYLTNKTVFKQERSPKNLIVLGAGPIGCELGQGFAQLGSQVTIIDMATSLFSKDDPEVGPLILQRFESDGIKMALGAEILSVSDKQGEIVVSIKVDGEEKKIKGDTLLVALGRKPNTQYLNMESVGIKTKKSGHIITDHYLRTNVKNIFAVGDVTGPYAFTHTAGYQASVVIQNAIFPVKKKVSYKAVPWVTYTKPEIAHVGVTEPFLKKKAVTYKRYMVPIINNDRAKAESDSEGFLKVLTDKKGVVIGATMVGEKAGEQIGLANLAVVKGLKISSFMSMTFPYPTEIEIYKTAALQAMKESFKPWQQQLIKRLFLR